MTTTPDTLETSGSNAVYRRGSLCDYARDPGQVVQVNLVSNSGIWERHSVLELPPCWSEAKRAYLAHFSGGQRLKVGGTQFLPVSPACTVVNLCAFGVHRTSHKAQFWADGLRAGLLAVARVALEKDASVHLPRLSRKSAGALWAEVEPIIRETLLASGLRVFLYDSCPKAKQSLQGKHQLGSVGMAGKKLVCRSYAGC